MSTFSKAHEHATSPMLGHFAEPDGVTYQPAGGGDATVVDAVIGPEVLQRRKDKHGALELVRQRSVLLKADDLSADDVQTNGTMIVAGRTYAIVFVGTVDGGLYEVELEAQAKGEITRDGYRR